MANLTEGQSIQVKGSGSSLYTIKYTGGVYSCSCPAWRNQSLPPNVRSCKHMVREGFSNTTPIVPQPSPVAPTPQVPVTPKEPPVLLAHTWDGADDLTGWWMSEKYDGVRCWWDGTKFLSRLGNEFHAPAWFTEKLPKETLDGELWMGRKLFQQTVGIVKKQVPVGDEWRKLTFMVFDAPDRYLPFEARNAHLDKVLAGLPYVKPVKQEPCYGIAHIKSALKAATAMGAEGLMLRKPGSMYEPGRSNTLLKVKEFTDAEATVTGYEPGKGKHKGRVGALVLRSDTGKEFKAGTGLSDKQRLVPPSVGSRVTYRYQELTQDGIPRFPVFLGARDYE